LSAGNHTDARTTQCTEQLPGNARRTFHVFTDDGHRSQFLFGSDLADLALRTFEGKLLIEHLHRQIGVGITYGERCIVFGTGLRHHEHTDAILRQRLEYAVVDADDTYHAQTLYRHQTGVVDRRDTFDERLARNLLLLLGNVCTRSVEIERVADKYRNILVINRIDRRRINNLRSEVTEFHGFSEGKLVDDVRRTDYLRIGRHEAIHISPYFQDGSIESRCQDRSGVIGTTASEVRHLARFNARRDKTGYYRYFRQRIECIKNQFVGQRKINVMLIKLADSLDELARIEQLRPTDDVRNDQRRNTFAIADDGIGCLRRQVLDQVYAFEDVAQLVHQLHHELLNIEALLCIGDHTFDHVKMASDNFGELAFVTYITFGCHS